MSDPQNSSWEDARRDVMASTGPDKTDKAYKVVNPDGSNIDTNILLKLQDILNAVDGLEGFTDGLETLLTSIDNKSTRAFSTPGNTRPTVTTTSSTVLAANASRKYVNIFNGSGAVIYIKLGATAVVNEGIRLVNNEMFEITSDKLWTGAINAIRGAGSGAIEVFEGT